MNDAVRRPRLTASLRHTETVTPLELFFDLIFVLAVTECTAMMAATPTWTGTARGLLVLATLWWAWVGYSWLTSVVDPEEGAVRFAIFGAMAAMLVVTLCIPGAFDDEALVFALAYGVVRIGQIVLFGLGSRDDPGLRRSVIGLGISTVIGVGLLAVASTLDGTAQMLMWLLAVVIDIGGPYLFGSDGWKLVPGHFAERHGLIVLIALGESIVAIGIGAGDHVDLPIVAAVVLGVASVAAMWWSYFDVTALVMHDKLVAATPGREQNELARDGWSYLHFVMIAGIVLFAFGLKKSLAHLGDPLHTVPATALCCGAAAYYLGHVALRWRMARSFAVARSTASGALAALALVAPHVPAMVSLALVGAVLWGGIVWEAHEFSEFRREMRTRAHLGAHPER
jgi:low temperature requirement protein LtrA